MRLLVTGISGFVGRHLAAFLAAEQPQVELVGLSSSRVEGQAWTHLAANLEGPDETLRAVREARPDRVVHLAAQSSPRKSVSEAQATQRTNVLGLLNLLEALRLCAPRARLLVVGSGEEYGASGADAAPLREDAPLRPITPYGVSKMAQSFLAREYHAAHGLHVVRTRTFNHSGAGRGADFAESSFAREIVAIEAGRAEPVIHHGNLDAVRDFLDVRDVVRAYWALLDEGRPGEVYNVCSGTGVAIRAVLGELIDLAHVQVRTQVDPDRLRVADIPCLVGDPSRLRQATGWRPRHTLRDALRALLDGCRQHAGVELRA
jgi:GDP-4-dehydro-6-deoxy-D-mannose reductase